MHSGRVDYISLNETLWAGENELNPQRSQFARRSIGEGRRILEIGVGGGGAGRHLAAGNRLFSMDIVHVYLRQLDSRTSGCSTANACQIPFRDGSFDAVYAGELIEHLTQDDGMRMVLEIRRILVPSGMMVLTTPNPGYIRTRLFRIDIGSPPHLKVYHPMELVGLVKSFGFRVQAVAGLGRMAYLLGSGWPLWMYGGYGIVASRA
jgi:2-polyprenyl-3-methyl-5-hydroxy-6-metoxy-1,4-benzoquinol methylase